ncbi:SET domain-containing protein [Rickenella mellea]|uniref:Histone-lysine N-methyltransferase SET5 n=1 Tax=Rickenella mellea TaxID=50990 RepID=A0A4Y7PKI9_9AGAM|nr:SET domain-containing protein [Rickenella mellea]
MSVTPSEIVLTAALKQLRAEHPLLGASKLHALLCAGYAGWSVSEKRVRKVLQAEGLQLAPPPAKKGGDRGTSEGDAGKGVGDVGDVGGGGGGAVYPSSRVLDGLDVKKWTGKVEVRYFGKEKGKGLVATETIEKGEVVWTEDPFIIAPEWDIYDLQQSSATCTYCTTPLTYRADFSKTLPCPSTTSPSHFSSSSHSSTSPQACPARFCTRLCLTRSLTTHPLLCPAQNPASIPFLEFARKTRWLAVHAVGVCASRILLANEDKKSRDGNGRLEEEWRFVRSLAELGMEERVEKQAAFMGTAFPQPDRATWKHAHTLFVQAFRTPTTPQHQKKLARILKTPLPDDIAAELFEYDAFLRSLGRMSLNLEAHGGLYTLHSHLNHSCSPNISVRHLGASTRTTPLSRISLIALRAIQPDEELVITYVDPGMGVKERRRELSAWGWGVCLCVRCVSEEGDEKEEGEGKTREGEAGGEADLEGELKAGLGVF